MTANPVARSAGTGCQLAIGPDRRRGPVAGRRTGGARDRLRRADNGGGRGAPRPVWGQRPAIPRRIGVDVLLRQLKGYLLALLLVAAVVSALVGDVTEAAIIFGIMAMSIGLSFVNEYRSERAVEALHEQIQHLVFVERDGHTAELDVTELVPGDIVHLRIGDVVPADLRLLEGTELECDESALTGSRLPRRRPSAACPVGESPLDLPCCAFMGTVVTAGRGPGWSSSPGRTPRSVRSRRRSEPACSDGVSAGAAGVLTAAGHDHGGAGRRDPGHQRGARPSVWSRCCSRSPLRSG